MPLADLPLSVLFLLFLLIFVLVGLYPAWKTVAMKISGLIRRHGQSDKPGIVRLQGSRTTGFAVQPRRPGLSSYEALVFKRLAQSGSKGISSKQIAADLHLRAVHVKQALKSLHGRGLIHVFITQMLSVRFSLSEKGHAFAVEQDFIPQIQQAEGRR